MPFWRYKLTDGEVEKRLFQDDEKPSSDWVDCPTKAKLKKVDAKRKTKKKVDENGDS
jgi:hypothetical protein